MDATIITNSGTAAIPFPAPARRVLAPGQRVLVGLDSATVTALLGTASLTFTAIKAPVSAVDADLTETLLTRLDRTVETTPFDFGAVGGGAVDDSYALQRAALAIHAAGGGRLYIPAESFLAIYPVHLFDDVELYGEGPGSVITFRDPSYDKGRGGFVMGSSVEANRDVTLANYASGAYKVGASTRNAAFVNPALGQFLRDNPAFVQIRNARIHHLRLVAQWSTLGDPSSWGGYAVNMANAWNCHAHDLWTEGFTEPTNIGSDVAPETPSCYLCTAHDLHVITPDPIHTYYALGFMANSTDCAISRARLHSPVTVDSDDGGGVGVSGCEDCIVEDITIDDLGRSKTSEGVLLYNSKSCRAQRIVVKNAKSAAADFAIAAYWDASKPNVLDAVTGENCDRVISLGNKNTRVGTFANLNSTADIRFLNENTSGCTVSKPVDTIEWVAGPDRWFLDNNVIAGWRKQSQYLLPVSIVQNDKATELFDYDRLYGRRVNAIAGTALVVRWPIPRTWKAVTVGRSWLTFLGNSQAAGAAFTISIRRLKTWSGNTSETPYAELTNTVNATNDATLDTNISTADGLILLSDTTHGLTALEFYAALTSPTENSMIKESVVEFYG